MDARKLELSDFRGTVKRGGAETGEIVSKMLIYKLQHTKIIGSRAQFSFLVWPYFSYDSWINLDTLKHNRALIDRVLQHEQNHYDIHLLTSTELRKILSSRFYTIKNSRKEIGLLEDSILNVETKLNKLYDYETNHGTLVSKQLSWNKLIEEAKKNESWNVIVQYCKLIEF